MALCQSCAMPMNKDPEKGGSNADGSRSDKYCSYCYKGGNFTWPDATPETMKALVIDKMVEMRYPRFLAKFFARSVPKLERWRAA